MKLAFTHEGKKYEVTVDGSSNAPPIFWLEDRKEIVGVPMQGCSFLPDGSIVLNGQTEVIDEVVLQAELGLERKDLPVPTLVDTTPTPKALPRWTLTYDGALYGCDDETLTREDSGDPDDRSAGKIVVQLELPGGKSCMLMPREPEHDVTDLGTFTPGHRATALAPENVSIFRPIQPPPAAE